jgi:pyruvate kinase
MHRTRRAKLVATVGPASASPEMLKALFHAGVDIFRMNFSHGTLDDHAKIHGAIRALEVEVDRPIGILQDLQGPKIRIGTIQDARIDVKDRETIRFVLSHEYGDGMSIPLPHAELFAAIAPDQELLIDDGRVRTRVTAVGDALVASVNSAGAR